MSFKTRARPTKAVDKNTLDLIRMLEETKARGSREDYFEEYCYEDVSYFVAGLEVV